MREHASSGALLALQLLEPLVLILGLHGYAIVKAIELVREVLKRLVGLAELDAQLPGRAFRRGGKFPLERVGRRGHLAHQLVLRGDDSALDFRLRGGGTGGEPRRSRIDSAGCFGAQLLAEFDSRASEGFAQANHLGAQVGPQRRDAPPIFGNLIRQEPDLAANLGELAEQLLAKCIVPASKAGDRFDDELEARPQFFEYGAYSVNRVVRHSTLLLSMDDHAEARPSHRHPPVVIGVPRPIDHERLALDIVLIDEAPKAAVVTFIAIVAHREDL